jgi:hypothetical protein
VRLKAGLQKTRPPNIRGPDLKPPQPQRNPAIVDTTPVHTHSCAERLTMTAGFAAIWVISQGTEPVLLCEGANVISTALIRSYSAVRARWLRWSIALRNRPRRGRACEGASPMRPRPAGKTLSGMSSQMTVTVDPVSRNRPRAALRSHPGTA